MRQPEALLAHLYGDRPYLSAFLDEVKQKDADFSFEEVEITRSRFGNFSYTRTPSFCVDELIEVTVKYQSRGATVVEKVIFSNGMLMSRVNTESFARLPTDFVEAGMIAEVTSLRVPLLPAGALHPQCFTCHYHHGMDGVHCAVHPCGPDSADCPDWKQLL